MEVTDTSTENTTPPVVKLPAQVEAATAENLTIKEMEVTDASTENTTPSGVEIPAQVEADTAEKVPDKPSELNAGVTAKEPDLYSYTRLDDFTSELYKIELFNLPSFVGFGQLRKFLNESLLLQTRKIKAIGNPPTFAFITFKNEKDRDYALNKLNGYQWKGKKLGAKLAAPAADPMAKKRREGDSEDCRDPKKTKYDVSLPVELKLKNAVTPYWNVPYEEQLSKKQDDIHKFLMNLSKDIGKVNMEFQYLLRYEKKKNFHQCCVLNKIIPSPVTTHYRNKCEFTCGRHLVTKEKTVGFRLSAYKEGSLSVAEPDDCINMGEPMLRAVKSFQSYIRQSVHDTYNPENHSGVWRQLTVRTSNNNDILLIVMIHPQSLTYMQLEAEKANLKAYFEEGEGSSVGVTSVYFQLFSKKSSNQEVFPLTHLMGKEFMEETILGLKFQVSPESFFQINVAAAEVLYTLIADLVNLTPHATVLDVCCGTGTISLCLAKAGFKVFGIEMCPEAVENARRNAKENNLSNVEFVCGKAEDVILQTLKRIQSLEVIAVVDPPRAGLHQKVLKVLRANPQITKLIYVSCNPQSAFSNFVDLCRAPSNNYKGSAFYPVRADVVDMFPYTPHKELVLFFKRSTDINLYPKDTDPPKEAAVAETTDTSTKDPEQAKGNDDVASEDVAQMLRQVGETVVHTENGSKDNGAVNDKQVLGESVEVKS